MECVKTFGDIDKLIDNIVITSKSKSFMDGTEIIFKGKNNILYLEENVCLKNSKITFIGDNNIVYLCSSRNAANSAQSVR